MPRPLSVLAKESLIAVYTKKYSRHYTLPHEIQSLKNMNGHFGLNFIPKVLLKCEAIYCN